MLQHLSGLCLQGWLSNVVCDRFDLRGGSIAAAASNQPEDNASDNGTAEMREE